MGLIFTDLNSILIILFVVEITLIFQFLYNLFLNYTHIIPSYFKPIRNQINLLKEKKIMKFFKNQNIDYNIKDSKYINNQFF